MADVHAAGPAENKGQSSKNLRNFDKEIMKLIRTKKKQQIA